MAETAEETEARLAKWTKFLESEEGKKSSLAECQKAGLAEPEEDDQDSDEEGEKKDVKDDTKSLPKQSAPPVNSVNT